MSDDRVEFGMSRKITDGNYGSIECHFSYSTDVVKGETLEDANDRCVTYVANVMNEKIEEMADIVSK